VKRFAVSSLFFGLDPADVRDLLILFATGLLFWTSITTMLPTLPTYIQELGGTAQQVGLVMGCFAIGLLGSRTWLGRLADGHSRKIVLLIGTAVGAIAPLGYYWLHSISGLMAVRAFHGISIAAFTTGYSALVVDLSPPKHRGEIVGYLSLAVPIGMAVGPAVGGILEVSHGYPFLFLVAAGLGFASLILASGVRGGKYQDEGELSEGSDLSERSFWRLLASPSLNVPAAILLIIGLVFGTLASFLPLYLRAIALDLNAGTFYTAAALASFIARIACGKASDRLGRGIFITGSLVCYGASMLLLSLTRSPRDFLLAAVLEGMGSGVLIPMMIALLSDRCQPQERGRVYAVCLAGFDVGLAIAGPLFGILEVIAGYRGMFTLSAGLAWLGLALFLSQSNHSFSHSLRFALGRGRDLYAIKVKS
jgi:MFS family permease